MRKEDGGYRTRDGKIWYDRQVAVSHEVSLDRSERQGAPANDEGFIVRVSNLIGIGILAASTGLILNYSVEDGGWYWALLAIPISMVFLGVVVYEKLSYKSILVIRLSLIAMALLTLAWAVNKYVI